MFHILREVGAERKVFTYKHINLGRAQLPSEGTEALKRRQWLAPDFRRVVGFFAPATET